MVCKNCGNTLRENEKFCTICGTYNDPSDSLEDDNRKRIPEDDMEDDSFDEIDEFSLQGKAEPKAKKKQQVQVEEYSPNEDPYVVAYIGEDYKWIAERPFNIYALLFSWIYFLYRKIYIIGIIGLAITGVILRISPMIVVPYIVLSMVGCGLFFNKYYLDTVERRVAKIQAKAKPMDDVEKICKRKGGVNVFMPLLIFSIFLGIMLFSYFNFNIGLENPQEPNFWSETTTNQANCKSLCRQIYSQSINEGETIEEMGCEISSKIGDPTTYYNIYLKINKSGSEKYVYYQNSTDGYFTTKGNTDLIEKLEKKQKEHELLESDKEYLQISKDLPNTFQTLRDDANYEDNLISKNANTKPKTHFVFTKDDIYQ